MRIGLTGVPGCGKSTVFNALTGQSDDNASGGRPGRVRLGSVKVPDDRVRALSDLYHPRKTTYAEVTFTDVAPDVSDGRGDRAILKAMREMEALCQVVRAFRCEVAGETANPVREIEELETEYILADLEIVERRVDRLTRERAGGNGSGQELRLMLRLKERLENGKPLRGLELGESELQAIYGYQFLSLKPMLLAINVDEEQVARPVPANVGRAARERGVGAVVLSARVEMDIAQMSDEEQIEFSLSLGLDQPARGRFLRSAFELLDLISMLTVGEDECRAWPIPRGTTAPRAAGKIHSDIERGFIRAEVLNWQDLIDLGGEAKCRDRGRLRIEGKKYVIGDGDVVSFRFNV
jgi:GTP-binding protein YchF